MAVDADMFAAGAAARIDGIVAAVASGDFARLLDLTEADAEAARHRRRAEALRQAAAKLPMSWSCDALDRPGRPGAHVPVAGLVADLERLAEEGPEVFATVVVIGRRFPGRAWDAGRPAAGRQLRSCSGGDPRTSSATSASCRRRGSHSRTSGERVTARPGHPD